MSVAYSVDAFGTTTLGAAAPMSVAPATAPSYENWLKFLSSTVPTSVTTPIFRVEVATDAAADVAGEGVLPPLQALATRARTAINESPIERVRMFLLQRRYRTARPEIGTAPDRPRSPTSWRLSARIVSMRPRPSKPVEADDELADSIGARGLPWHAPSVRYVALGDSYTIGTSVAEVERWPNQLVAALAPDLTGDLALDSAR